MQRFVLTILIASATSAAWGFPAPEEFYLREDFPASAGFGWAGTAQTNGLFLVWNGDQVYRQSATDPSKLELIAEGYIGDPAFMILGRTAAEAILGAGTTGDIYFLDLVNPVDFVPGSALNIGSHFGGVLLNAGLLAVDRGDGIAPAEIEVVDISGARAARAQTVMRLPAPPEGRDVVVVKPGGSFSANLAINGDSLYITDAGNGQIKIFSVNAVVNAFNTMTVLDWDMDGTDFGMPFQFPLGGVEGFTGGGNVIISGFGSILSVNPSTLDIVTGLDPAGTGPFYTVIYNRALEELIAIDASIPSVIYATRDGLSPRRACGDEDEIRTEYDDLIAGFTLAADLDMDGIPDSAMLELIILASCQMPGAGLVDATRLAYEHNLGALNREAAFMSLEPYQHALAALMMMSQAMQDALRAVPGISLAETYTIVTAADLNNFLPAFGTGAGAVVPDPMLMYEEVYAGANDADFDGFTNKQEFDNITAIGGNDVDFAVNAFSRALNGSGVVVSGNCFVATAAFGTPLAPEIGRLRDFRDRYLLTTALGTAFTDAYYHLSPRAADFIATRPVLRAGVRGGIHAGLWGAEHPRVAWGIFWTLAVGVLIGYHRRIRAGVSRGSGGA